MNLGANLLVLVVLLVVATQCLSRLTRRKLERRLGAKPIRTFETSGFFGIRFGFKLLKYKSDGVLTDFLRTRFLLVSNPKADTFIMKVFGKQGIMTRDTENIKAMLATQFDDFSLGHLRTHAYPLLGDCIFVSEGETWSHSRAMLRPQFTRKQVGRLSLLENHLQRLVQNIRSHRGNPFNMQDLCFRFTIDSATSILFGESAKALGNFQDDGIVDNIRFAKAFDIVQEVLARRLMLQGMHFLCRVPEYERSLEIVNEFAAHYIEKTLSMLQEELEETKKSGFVFLHSLVQETRDPKVLRDELLGMLLAGRDTVATLITFTLYELARNSNLWNTLRQEVVAVFGTETDTISFESLKQCKFLKALLNELLRMYPPVPLAVKTARRTTTIPRGGGEDGLSPVLIRCGETVAYSVYAMHRNPTIYGDNAQVFDPSRWLDGRTKGISWEFLPFSGGPRVCLGQQFALMEASYFLTRLAQIFPNFALAQPNVPYPPRIANQITIKLMDGLYVTMS